MAAKLYCIFIIAGMLTCLLAIPASANESGVVIRALDGDSLLIRHKGRDINVRLFGIDAPEKGQPYSGKAKAFLQRFAQKQKVVFVVKDKDKHGRTVATVHIPSGLSAGAAMLNAGLAWWYQRYAPDEKRYESLEKAARDAKHGLWKDPNPIPPWDYRQKKYH